MTRSLTEVLPGFRGRQLRPSKPRDQYLYLVETADSRPARGPTLDANDSDPLLLTIARRVTMEASPPALDASSLGRRVERTSDPRRFG